MDGNSEQLITELREGREKAFTQVFRMYYALC